MISNRAAPWLLLGGAVVSAASLCMGGPRYTGRYLYRSDAAAAYNV